jgi:type II secretory pathway pseudopilin PulG
VRVRGQAGFTLIELIVAMAAGMIVLGAIVTILLTTLSQTQLLTDRVAATRETRQALATIENELHSACVGTGTAQNLAPIQPGSNADQLIFVSYLGTAVNPTPMWHVLTYSPTARTLTDASYNVTGTNGNWVPASAPTSTTTVLDDVTTQGTTNFFQYFAYQHYPIANSTQSYWTIPDGIDILPNGTMPSVAPEPQPLSSGAAAATVEVLITLEGYAGVPGASSGQASGDPEADAVSLRLTDPPNQAPVASAGSYAPCE